MSTEYPLGQEPDFWEPDPEEQSHRFALGNVQRSSISSPPLIAICMNPSHATRFQADRTVKRLIKASIDNRASGWLMLNLYPERATDASNLSQFDPGLSAANCEVIGAVLRRFGAGEVLGAWGGLKNRTLRRARADVLETLERLDVKLFTFDGLTGGGEPRHPTPRGTPLQMRGDKRFLMARGAHLVEHPHETR